MEGGGVTAERASELGCLKSKWEEMDKTRNDNVYLKARMKRRTNRRVLLTAGD